MINLPTGRSIDIYCSPVGDIDIIELMKKYIKILGKVRPTVDGDWSKDKSYDILTIVYDKDSKKSYISRKNVPIGINILNKDYWMNISTTRVDNDSIVLLSNSNDIGQINSFTLQEAVDSFDNEDKRIGLFISFYEKPVHELDTYKWNLYQFIGSDINQFNDITKWISIYNRSNKFLGLYLTEGKLNEVKRNPEVGDYAFVGNTLKEAIVYRCNVNGKWAKTKESAVDYIELKLSGNVTVGENGNWFNNGVDTGFKAKGEDGKTPQIVVSKDNKLQVSYDGINFTNITENIVYTQYRVSGNKLQYSIDLGKTWNDASGFISANFRWKPTSVAAGKIQISRENEVWEDLSPEFVSNSADEEDLESVIIGDNNRVIREKSVKEYNPTEFSGLGRVILRKNIVQGKNVLTQEMINKPNTVYEIRYDFDLNDTTINVPENCTLDFQGGSFSNGFINGNKTNILCGNFFIFKNNINIIGSYYNSFKIEWFGVKGIKNRDDSIYLQKAFNIINNAENALGTSIKLIGNNCYLNKSITINTPNQFSSWNINITNIIGDVDDYLIILNGQISSCTLTINEIVNEKGGCIKCISDIEGNTWMGTSTINSNRMKSNINFDCVHLEADIDFSKSWINDNTINVGRFVYGKNGLFAKGCNQLLLIRPDFEYGGCYLENCIGTTLVCPHFADKGVGDYILNTVGKCYNFNIIGGSCARFAFNEVTPALPAFSLSDKTYGTIMSYQENPNIEHIVGQDYRGTLYKIVEGNIFYYEDTGITDILQKSNIYDTTNLSSLNAHKKIIFSNETSEFILNDKYYGGLGKINEIFIKLNNKKLTIFYYSNSTKNKLVSFINSNYGIVKLIWFYNSNTDTQWICITDNKIYNINSKNPIDIYINNIGLFDNKPSSPYINYKYYCTDLKKEILWDGSNWIDHNGNIPNISKLGTTSQRPTGVQIGFTYKDTDLNKWIIWNGEAWENIDGTALI